jgi:hypothetical protein
MMGEAKSRKMSVTPLINKALDLPGIDNEGFTSL